MISWIGSVNNVPISTLYLFLSIKLQDDKKSLAELHEYLNYGDEECPNLRTHRLSSASSIKSERRRSLPTSMISVVSEYSVTTPRPDITEFQARRRRAAKLTQFFGVDYRELINDILESIELGLEQERSHGTLNAHEVEVCSTYVHHPSSSQYHQQDLQMRLRTLRTKREGLR